MENQEKWRAVNKITQQINSTIDNTSLYKIIIEELLTILDIHYCSICVFDETENKFILHCVENINYDDNHLYLLNFVEHCNLSLSSNNYNTVQKMETFSYSLGKNYSSVPLINKNKFLGTIFVYNKSKPVDDDNLQILALVADSIAGSIMNANLYSILKKRDQEKLEFIAGMSHEFKNPLNAIIGFTDLLKQGALYDEIKAMKYLENISNSSKHLSSLIGDILDMARAESGKIELTYGEFSPKLVILEIIASSEKAIAEKQIIMNASLVSDKIEGDAKRFRQIIDNLLSNSLKFAYEKSEISIKTKCENEFFYFEIKDNGEGISKENQSKLFKFFSQANGKNTKHKEGYGIGLSLCKRFVELHKGDITFNSEKGVGSTFQFKLPVKNPESSRTCK